MELYIFDMYFNRLGIIDHFEEVSFEQHYLKHSKCFLAVEGSARNGSLLIANELRIIVRSDDLTRGYLIDVAKYEDASKLYINVIATSLSIMLSWRTIKGQQMFTGNIEDVAKAFVNANCINPENPKRVIPNLILGPNNDIEITTEEAFTDKPLDVALWEMCEKHEISFEILLDHDTKKFVFVTYQGVDCSAQQRERPPVIFAKSFDNVIKQHYTNDTSNLKTTAFVAGEGEGVNRTVVTVGNEFEGYARREIFFDARDLQRTYTNENNQQITISEQQYLELLKQRGENRLSEYQHIRTFTSDIDMYTQFRYKEHYFLGDIVSNRNDELGIINHSRVVSVYETFNSKGRDLKIDFGTSIPTLIDKLKREVKR